MYNGKGDEGMKEMKAEEAKKIAEERRIRRLVEAVKEDFEARRSARRSLERCWEMNMNFYSGNQYYDLSPEGELTEEDRAYYWQSRRVFNRIAPTVDTRCAKLEKNRPRFSVRAFSDEEADVKCARLAAGVLAATAERIGLDEIVNRATVWSEICGTAFYKVAWDPGSGRTIGEGKCGKIREGEVSVTPLSPFEVFPDRLNADRMEEIRSIIHAKALPVGEIAERFGVSLPGREIGEFTMLPYSSPSHQNVAPGGQNIRGEAYEIVIERYTMPDSKNKNGRLEIVAGDKLLYEGALPYENGESGERILPFVRQTSLSLPGAFFGASIVDRLIPLQRAYNAVKNRKHEFLNRISTGVVTVEDGAVDTDELSEDGLCPGKILVYRQGSQPPALLDCGTFPSEFGKEEESLVEEFAVVSGTSEITRNSSAPANVTSATGLQLLLDQEGDRLSVSMRSISRAMEEIGRQILKLYKQFASTGRVARMSGEGRGTEAFYFDAADLSVEDVTIDCGTAQSPEQKRAAVLQLLELGLLSDDDGKLSKDAKNKILETLGYGNLSGIRDISALHISRAEKENILLSKGEEVRAESYDDHEAHYTEHVRFLLSEGFDGNEETKARVERHICEHLEYEKKGNKREKEK